MAWELLLGKSVVGSGRRVVRYGLPDMSTTCSTRRVDFYELRHSCTRLVYQFDDGFVNGRKC